MIKVYPGLYLIGCILALLCLFSTDGYGVAAVPLIVMAAGTIWSWTEQTK